MFCALWHLESQTFAYARTKWGTHFCRVSISFGFVFNVVGCKWYKAIAIVGVHRKIKSLFSPSHVFWCSNKWNWASLIARNGNDEDIIRRCNYSYIIEIGNGTVRLDTMEAVSQFDYKCSGITRIWYDDQVQPSNGSKCFTLSSTMSPLKMSKYSFMPKANKILTKSLI